MARVEEISDAMEPIGERGAMRELAALFAVMAIRNASEDEASALMAVYAADLGELPAFALAEACRAYRRGILGDGKWLPTPGEIYQAAVRAVEGPAKECRAILSILSAKISTPQISAERKREIIEQTRLAARAADISPTMDEMRDCI